jgi:hypothetical protein
LDPSVPRLRQDDQSPAYAVPGVVPERTEGRSVRYRGDQLQATDAVAAALDRAPQVWPALFDCSDEDEFGTITRDNLCGLLYLSSQDGQTWDLGFEEVLTCIVQIEPDFGEDDLIEQALAALPDVAGARHVDVDWFQVSTERPLRADEMLALFIDALAAAHRHSAQHRPESHSIEPLDPRTLSALAAKVAATMAEHGFAGLRVDLAKGQESPEYGLLGFYRTCAEPLVHAVLLMPGSGSMDDGTGEYISLEGTVRVDLRVSDISTLDPTASIVGEVAGREYVKGILVGNWTRHAVPPSAGALVRLLLDECLPWFDTVRSRAAIVNQWVRAPHSQPPWHLPEKIEVAARWDMRDEASAMLRYGRLEEPQYERDFAAVAEKFQLQTDP